MASSTEDTVAERCGRRDARRCGAAVSWLALMGMIFFLSACSTVVSSATRRLAGDLADAMADHDDAATVAAAAPAYLVMMDAMVQSNPQDPRLLVKASGR